MDAALSSDPLLVIANGDFGISDTTTDSFAWDTRGASGIENDTHTVSWDFGDGTDTVMGEASTLVQAASHIEHIYRTHLVF